MEPIWQAKTHAELSAPAETRGHQRQHRQMMVALGLLLAALLVVVVKDREFWFPAPPEQIVDSAEVLAPPATISDRPSASATKETSAPPQAVKSKAHPPVRAEHEHMAAAAARVSENPPVAGPSISASNRTPLPPLEVEVVAGGQPTVLQPSNHSVKVDMEPETPEKGASPTASTSTDQPAPVATNADERVRLSPDTAQIVERPVQPNYPMLAKQMKVQGSVVLQALIGQEGSIQDLRVLSGPAILSKAAMDAVRQWRFRPYLQSGQPIETEARVTVNFTISTY